MSKMLKNPPLPGRPLRLFREDHAFSDFSTDSLVGHKLNFYKGWICAAGVENISIDNKGNVYRATCQEGGSLGSIFGDLNIPNQWIECSQSTCSCGADLFIPKASGQETRHLVEPTSTSHETSTRKDYDPNQKHIALTKIHEIDRKQIYWELGPRCNYSCSYCGPTTHDDHSVHRSLTELVAGALKLEENFLKGRGASYVFSGGEPTLNPDLLPFLQFLKDFGHKISIHSNGSRLPEYYKKLIHLTNLNISVHFEFYKESRLLKVVEAIVEEKVRHKNIDVGHLELKLMMKPGDRTIALALEEKLSNIPKFKECCTLAIVPIRGQWGTYVVDGYEKEDFALFGDRP